MCYTKRLKPGAVIMVTYISVWIPVLLYTSLFSEEENRKSHDLWKNEAAKPETLKGGANPRRFLLKTGEGADVEDFLLNFEWTDIWKEWPQGNLTGLHAHFFNKKAQSV